MDQFIALLLAVYIEAGLLEALVTLIEDAAGTLGRKATLLLGEVLQMSNRILPLQYAAQIQVGALPQISMFRPDELGSSTVVQRRDRVCSAE